MDAQTSPSSNDRFDPSKTPEQFVILPLEIRNGRMSISTYQRIAHTTDKLPDAGLELTTLGLFGEVGSLLSAFKKLQRDRAAFKRYSATILEELGDTLWYFSTLATRAQIDLPTIAQQAFRDLENWDSAIPAVSRPRFCRPAESRWRTGFGRALQHTDPCARRLRGRSAQ